MRSVSNCSIRQRPPETEVAGRARHRSCLNQEQLRHPALPSLWPARDRDSRRLRRRRYYTEAYFQGGAPDGYYDYLGSERLLAREHCSRLGLVPAYVSTRLLELGCASGGFLTHAREHFAVQGVDASQFAVEAARRRGLDVSLGSLEEAVTLATPDGVVAAFDTIEHLPRPRQSLERSFSLLRPGSYLLLTAGDARSFLARLLGKRWRLLTPLQHLWFFDQQTLGALLRSLGFEVLAVRYGSRLVPLSLAWHELFRGGGRQLPRAIGERVLRVNLFDTMTVVARRPPDVG